VKSTTVHITRLKACFYEGLQFFIFGKSIVAVDEFPCLGHIFTSYLDDKSDTFSKRNYSLVKLTIMHIMLFQ